ncbi:TonB-dependent receptor [Parahaliea mediterranea]|uniref:TonB-dependent receptor n=1 Tax=Parahaliea mediterranea TaxID=651086 RepID=A0A939DDV7_9GAMM|nr:TonB-dependent receptor [Parahaliea mediterranea]MBN7796076.1 TonB-dependent receptor [Parahaliea mediterranea]
MISKARFSALSVIPLGITVLSLQSTAAEQVGNDDSPHIEETIVTGSKRDTTLIESDLSATIIDSNMIDEVRLRDFRRIDDLAPNVQFSESGQRGSIYITVRGVESNPFIINRAAIYIDGIPFRELSNSVLNQTQSIEVLRGPQATLYGANTESGLIIVSTKQPSEEVSAELRLTGIDFESGNGLETDGFISGPIIRDKLAGSIAFNVAEEDAYVKNLGTSTGETGKIDETFLQGRLRWTPTDTLTVNATAYWLDMDAPGLFDQQYMPLDIDRYNALYADYANGGRRADGWTTFEDAPKLTTEEEWVIGISATQALDYGSLDLAASYRKLEENAMGLDFDLTASPLVSASEKEQEAFTNLEARFSSPEVDVIDYIIGVSYYQDYEENAKASFIGTGGLDSYIAAPAQRKESEDYGVFGSVNWYLTPKLRLSGGLRYDNATRSTQQKQGQLDLGYGSIVYYVDADLTETYEAFLPRLAAHYTVSNNFSVHATLAKGYIPGGFNLVAVQQGYSDPDIISYDSEALWSREIGFKWRSADRRMRASGAVFHITSDSWQEVQIATDETGRPVSSDFISSDASIRSQGAELEGHWQVTDALSVDAHIGYVDAEYRDLQLDDTTNVKGQSIQLVPEYDGGLALRYEWPNGFFVRGEAGFTGKMALRARGDAIQDAVETFGLQAGYKSGRWAVRIFGDNLSDERRGSGLAIENLAFGTDGLFYSPLDAPRIIGVELEAWY